MIRLSFMKTPPFFLFQILSLNRRNDIILIFYEVFFENLLTKNDGKFIMLPVVAKFNCVNKMWRKFLLP